MRFLLFTPLIESALLKMLLKAERSWLQFMNLNVLRTKRNEFLRLSLFNHVLAGLCYRLVAGPKATCVKHTWSIIYNLKILTCRPNFFWKAKEHFLFAVYTKNRKLKHQTLRSWYHGRQPEVFFQHDSHCACQEFLRCGDGLQNASTHVETRGSNSGFFEEYSSNKSKKFFVWNHVFFVRKKQNFTQIFERHFQMNYSVGVRDCFTLSCFPWWFAFGA